jgi:Tol biopolymer transport system component
LRIIAAAGGQPRVVSDPNSPVLPSEPQWSPDGRSIIAQDEMSYLVHKYTVGAESKRFGTANEIAIEDVRGVNGRWLNREWIVYTQRPEQQFMDFRASRASSDLWLKSVKSGAEMQLTATSDEERTPRPSLDGRRCAYVVDGGASEGIWVLDLRWGE